MSTKVAVLGAGIMGSSTALFLARRDVDVVLYDESDAVFSGASRWNEGKIHLGFLYAGDPSLRTARRLLPGGLMFRPLIEELLDCRLENITQADDMVLVHRDSVVTVDEVRSYFVALSELVEAHRGEGEYLVDLNKATMRELTAEEIGTVADPDLIAGGFAVPERSISTNWVADRFVDAIEADPNIEVRTGTRVVGVRPQREGFDSWHVNTDAGEDGPYSAVVNALWEGRPVVDATLGIQQQAQWTHRYRVSLFVETSQPVQAPSALLSVGPFGDIKNYNDRQFYLSWYPSGLLVSGTAIDPPPVPAVDSPVRRAKVDEIFRKLSGFFPAVHEIQEQATRVSLNGGWVYASGEGKLSERSSTLHQRHRVGINQKGSYYSVDTGKYSIAPGLARQVADSIVASRVW